MKELANNAVICKKTSYSRRLASMYYQLQRQQQRGLDLSAMDNFLRELSCLVNDNKETNLTEARCKAMA